MSKQPGGLCRVGPHASVPEQPQPQPQPQRLLQQAPRACLPADPTDEQVLRLHAHFERHPPQRLLPPDWPSLDELAQVRIAQTLMQGVCSLTQPRKGGVTHAASHAGACAEETIQVGSRSISRAQGAAATWGARWSVTPEADWCTCRPCQGACALVIRDFETLGQSISPDTGRRARTRHCKLCSCMLRWQHTA